MRKSHFCLEAANAAVKTADYNKQFADVTFARYKELYRRRSVSGQEHDEAGAQELSPLAPGDGEIQLHTVLTWTDIF